MRNVKSHKTLLEDMSVADDALLSTSVSVQKLHCSNQSIQKIGIKACEGCKFK